MKRIWFDRDVRILGTWSIKGNAPGRIYCPIVISKTKIFWKTEIERRCIVAYRIA
jgi:hypothetical protein